MSQNTLRVIVLLSQNTLHKDNWAHVQVRRRANLG